MNYWLIFLAGLTTGGLSCLALQGGLLASAIIENEEEASNKKNRLRAITLFLLAKLGAYTIFGIFLGWLGSELNLSPKTFALFSILIALFMLGVALETLKVHPIFRYFLIQPPKFIRSYIKKTSKNQGDFAAILLGVITILIPCGVTQAMMALAVSSGNIISGMLTMFFFILGTIPVFFVLGYMATTLGQLYHNIFSKVIGIILIIISIWMINSSLKVMGFKLDINTQTAQNTNNEITKEPIIEGNIQKIKIKVNDSYGYNPARIKLKKDIPVELTVTGDNARGCIRAFVIPDLGIREIVPVNSSIVINFTPTKTGKMIFTCSMGMYDGQFIVE